MGVEDRIQYEDWLKELLQYRECNGHADGLTVLEILEASNTPQTRSNVELVRRRLRLGLREGAIECVKSPRPCIDGRTMLVSVYHPAARNGAET